MRLGRAARLGVGLGGMAMAVAMAWRRLAASESLLGTTPKLAGELIDTGTSTPAWIPGDDLELAAELRAIDPIRYHKKQQKKGRDRLVDG